MRWAFCAAAAAALFWSASAEAQTRRARTYSAAPEYGAPATGIPNRGRVDTRFTTPPGYQGTIRWNTPNADGNFGNASTGGGSGNPGG